MSPVILRGGTRGREIARSKHLALGGHCRRVRGAAVAMVATARKVAELYYLAMTRSLD